MSIVESLVTFCAPYAKIYNHSKLLSNGTTWAHLASMMAAGGVAISADRKSLLLPAGDAAAARSLATELGTLHRWVITGLVVSAVSGGMMFAADVDAFATSPLYWSKMGTVALLLGNGLLLQRAELGLATTPEDPTARERMRVAAATSLVLWFAVSLLGTVLKNEA